MTPEMKARLWREIDAIIEASEPRPAYQPQPLRPTTDYLPRSHRVATRLGAAFLVGTAITTVAAYGALAWVVWGWARRLGAGL